MKFWHSAWSTLTFRKFASLAFFAVIFALLFVRAMNQSLGHDEEQHVASGQLLAERGLIPYVDYPFLHMPYIAGINALVTKVTDYDLLAARSSVALFGFLSALILFSISRHLLRGSSFGYLTGFVVVLLFVFNPLFINTHTRATNHALPSLMSLFAFVCFRKGASQSQRLWWFGLSGVSIGLATGLRLSYAVLIPAFTFAVLLLPNSQPKKERFREAIALGVGVFVALLPAFVLFLLAPGPFFYGNYVYIRLNTLYYQQLDHPIAMVLSTKIIFFLHNLIQNPIYWLLLLTAMTYGVIASIQFLKSKERPHFEPVFVSGLIIVLLLTAFAPTPSQPQYFFAPFPFLLVSFVYMIRDIESKNKKFGFAAIGFFFLFTLMSGSFLNAYKDLKKITNPEEWQTVRVHRFAENLRSLVPEGKILTLAPIVPLEAGLDVYEVFAVGPFSWRTAHLVGDETRKEFGIISFTDLDEFLRSEPPKAILVGFEGRQNGFKKQDAGGLEKPFIDHALKSGFVPTELPAEFVDVPITLWVHKLMASGSSSPPPPPGGMTSSGAPPGGLHSPRK